MGRVKVQTSGWTGFAFSLGLNSATFDVKLAEWSSACWERPEVCKILFKRIIPVSNEQNSVHRAMIKYVIWLIFWNKILVLCWACSLELAQLTKFKFKSEIHRINNPYVGLVEIRQ